VNKVTCYYFTMASGKVPVRAFVDSLQPKTQMKFFFVKGLLEEFGRSLCAPHSKCIGDQIFELRFMGQEGAVRLLYFFFHQDKAILTNGFIKKTNKTPRREKVIARERRRMFFKARK